MMKRYLWLCLIVSACAPAPGDKPSGELTGACVRSFRPTLEAWEAELGRVPAECAYLDQEYSVELFSAAELPCDDPGPGEQVLGCTEQPTMAIYILKRRGRRVLVHHGHKSRTNVELVDTSVHEWIHALADCVDSDMDLEHVRVELWAPFGAESVEIQGQAFAEIGDCL
jgi:hypothetical protein